MDFLENASEGVGGVKYGWPLWASGCCLWAAMFMFSSNYTYFCLYIYIYIKFFLICVPYLHAAPGHQPLPLPPPQWPLGLQLLRRNRNLQLKKKKAQNAILCKVIVRLSSGSRTNNTPQECLQLYRPAAGLLEP